MTKRLREIFLQIIHRDGRPEDIARAFAVGVYVAFFPVFGTHTAMAFGFAWLLRLSPAVVLAGTLVNNPWTIAPVYGGSLYVGMVITGRSLASGGVNWGGMNWNSFVVLFKAFAVPFVAGCTLMGVLSALVSYAVILKAVRMYRLSGKGAVPPALGD